MNGDSLTSDKIIISDIESSQFAQCFTHTVINFMQSPIAIKLNTLIIEPFILKQLLASEEEKLLLGHNLMPNTSNCETSMAIGLIANDLEVSVSL